VRAAYAGRGGGDREQQAPLDRPAFVQAQDDAGGERIARADGAADLLARQPDRALSLRICANSRMSVIHFS
jgi:hypothetical protein